jgi:hypothetical protein
MTTLKPHLVMVTKHTHIIQCAEVKYKFEHSEHTHFSTTHSKHKTEPFLREDITQKTQHRTNEHEA